MFPLSSSLSAFRIGAYKLNLFYVHGLQHLKLFTVTQCVHSTSTLYICQPMLLAADHALSSVAFAVAAVWTFGRSQAIFARFKPHMFLGLAFAFSRYTNIFMNSYDWFFLSAYFSDKIMSVWSFETRISVGGLCAIWELASSVENHVLQALHF